MWTIVVAIAISASTASTKLELPMEVLFVQIPAGEGFESRGMFQMFRTDTLCTWTDDWTEGRKSMLEEDCLR
ncbi:hypothetical protein QLX08_002401 [Tetragonisca angustula]|uniref:Uncharacterized protein n=1 Tax=Tetragonisca angustula TaxID=166442 RepID=A0AAW1ABZ8_9HYME